MGKIKSIISKKIDDIFYEIVKGKSTQQYKQKIEELRRDGKLLSKEERNQLRHRYIQRNAKKAKRKAKRLGLAAGLIMLGGVIVSGANKLLNPPVEGVKYNQSEEMTVVNLDEIQGELKITGSKEKQFRDELARATISEEARERAEETIEIAQEPREVLKIVEDTVAEYWEESYGEEVTGVNLNKITENVSVYKDTAKNGDEIKRYKRGSNDSVNNTLIIASIYTEENSYNENVSLQFGKYYTVYNSTEEVEKAEDSKIIEIAEMVQSGIEYAVGMKQNQLGNTSDEVLDDYKENFTEELAKYYDANLQREVFGEQPEQENTVEVENEIDQ